MFRNKLAFIIPSLNAGGAERVVSTLVNELINDFEILIIVLYKCEPFYPLNKNIKIAYCKGVYNKNPSKIYSVFNHFQLLAKAFRLIKKHNTSIIIGFMTTANIYVILLSKLLRIPSIISVRLHPKFGINSFWNMLRRHSYPKADKIVVQTQEIKDYFNSFINSNKLEIIQNPLNTALTNQRTLSTSKEKIILNVGRLDDQKNQDLLIRAFSSIKNSDWKLILAGNGKNESEYRILVKSLGIEDKVKFVGNVTDIANYYNKASIFAFTSRYEGFPNALTEAMFFGLPCVSTDCPSGPSELIHNSKNGFLIPVGDQIELEQRLTLLMNSPSLRKEIGYNALKSTTSFEVSIISMEWKTLINNLIL